MIVVMLGSSWLLVMGAMQAGLRGQRGMFSNKNCPGEGPNHMQL